MSQLRRLLTTFVFGVGLLVVAAVPARASIIDGSFNFSVGQVLVGTDTLGGQFIDWNSILLGDAPDYPPGFAPQVSVTYGSFTVAPVTGGIFNDAGFVGSTAQIHDMSNDPTDANFVPIGAGSTPNFFIFSTATDNANNWVFTENFLVAGDLGPFVFSTVGGNTSVTMTVNGTVYDPLENIVSTWTAIITSQYTNLTTDQLIAGVLNNTLPNNTWSGTFTATAPSAVPEPATLILLGTGLIGVGARARRRLQKK